MLHISFKNSIGEITFGYSNEDYILYSYDDNQSVNNWVTTGYAQHGTSYIKSLMRERTITLTFYIIANNGLDLYTARERAIKVFNPTAGMGVLTYSNDYLSRAIDCYISAVPYEVENQGCMRRFSVELNAPFPFYRDINENGIMFASSKGGMQFDFVFNDTIQFGTEARTATITNKGDIEAPIRVEIKGAAMVNPKIILAQNKQFIGITRAISENENIIITTDYGNKDVKINGANAARYLTAGYSWLQLPIGDSTLSCITDAGEPSVYLYWYNWYLGV